MEAQQHVLKFRRLHESLVKLSCQEDCELIVEVCMLAGTHLVNAALHSLGFREDIIHSDFLKEDGIDGTRVLRPNWAQFNVPPLVGAALQSLARIEGFRATHVRGPHIDSAAPSSALEALREIHEAVSHFTGQPV